MLQGRCLTFIARVALTMPESFAVRARSITFLAFASPELRRAGGIAAGEKASKAAVDPGNLAE